MTTYICEYMGFLLSQMMFVLEPLIPANNCELEVAWLQKNDASLILLRQTCVLANTSLIWLNGRSKAI